MAIYLRNSLWNINTTSYTILLISEAQQISPYFISSLKKKSSEEKINFHLLNPTTVLQRRKIS